MVRSNRKQQCTHIMKRGPEPKLAIFDRFPDRQQASSRKNRRSNMKSKIRTVFLALSLIFLVANVFFLATNRYYYGSCTVDRAIKHQTDYQRFRDTAFIDSLDVKSKDSDKQFLSDSLLDCVTDKFYLSAEWENTWGNSSLASNSSFISTLSPTMLRNFIYKLLAKLESQNSVISFLSEPIINNHMFPYIHQPVHACSDTQTEVLFVVPSAPGNFERRLKVRKAKSAEYARNPSNKAKMLFFLGALPDNQENLLIQGKVDEEVEKYGDIVQENFEDIYRNIRLKAVSMLRWAVTFCPRAHYVIRTDDDVRVDPARLVAAIRRKQENYVNFIMGERRENLEPHRNKSSKYYLSEDEYPLNDFPPFLLGGLLGYPLRTVKLLYQAALREKPIWLDDVYITGIIATKLNIPLVEDPDFRFQHYTPKN